MLQPGSSSRSTVW